MAFCWLAQAWERDRERDRIFILLCTEGKVEVMGKSGRVTSRAGWRIER